MPRIALVFALVGQLFSAVAELPPSAMYVSTGQAKKVQSPAADPGGRGASVVSQDDPGGRLKELKKVQAIETLKGITHEANELGDFDERVPLICGAADLLWSHDQAAALASLSRLLDDLFDQYKASAEQRAGDRDLRTSFRSSISTTLSTLEKHDKAAAAAARQRYKRVIDEAIGGRSSPPASLNARLADAIDTLDVGAKQSALLGASAIQSGIPSDFPQYLYSLEVTDQASAVSLANQAIGNLVSVTGYRPTDALYLSAYVFRERMMVMIYPWPDEKGPPRFGMSFGPPFQISLDAPDPGLQGAFLTAALPFLTSQLSRPAFSTAPDPLFVGHCLFMATKMSGYASQLGLDPAGAWPALIRGIETGARVLNIDAAQFEWTNGFAQRFAAKQPVAQFDRGAATAFAIADATDDPAKKQAIIARAVAGLADQKEFDLARQKLKDIDNVDVRKQVSDWVSFQAGRDDASHGKWPEVTADARMIENRELRLFLLLEAGAAAAKAKKNEHAVEYLNEAVAIVPKLDDRVLQAGALVMAAGCLDQLDRIQSKSLLIDAKNAMNRAPQYQGKEIVAQPKILEQTYFARLSGSDMNQPFTIAARTDWFTTIAVIKEIEARGLRLAAQLAACRAIL